MVSTARVKDKPRGARGAVPRFISAPLPRRGLPSAGYPAWDVGPSLRKNQCRNLSPRDRARACATHAYHGTATRKLVADLVGSGVKFTCGGSRRASGLSLCRRSALSAGRAPGSGVPHRPRGGRPGPRPRTPSCPPAQGSTPDFSDGSVVSAWRLRVFPGTSSVSEHYLLKRPRNPMGDSQNDALRVDFEE